MSASTAELTALIRSHRQRLETIRKSIDDALDQEIKQLGKTDRSALIIAGLLENYYTCAETIFLRISQYFENNLDAERWHSDLLQKMKLNIEGVRMNAVAPEDVPRLYELLKFRHFKRYYFDLDYDWDRLDFLVRKVRQLHPSLGNSLERFVDFLQAVG